MEERTTNDSSRAEPFILLIRDCSQMDTTMAKRLQSTLETSLAWADQMLDVLIQLDDDLQAFESMVKPHLYSLRLPESHLEENAGNPIPGVEEIACQVEKSVQHLRSGVRDVMMSMQNQDVIGQSIGRAAAALDNRIAALKRAVEGRECNDFHTSEVADIHHVYRADDDLHQAKHTLVEETYHDKEEYKAAA